MDIRTGTAASPWAMRKTLLLACITFLASAGSTAAPTWTGVTGSGQAFDNMQPSLTVTEVLPLTGIFPSSGSGGSAYGDTLGFVYDFAGNYTPGGSIAAQGQLLPINQNQAVFSLLGTTYGGNGTTNFAVPNLAGRAIVGTGTGPGLSSQPLGTPTGSASVSLSIGQLPSHDHTLSGGGVTGATGSNQPFSNIQPSLPLQRVIATAGAFPGVGSASFLGQIATFVGNFIPAGWASASGQLLPIAQNTALFSILGTTYGGNGTTTFALPDLRGRVSVGADGTHPLGMIFGEESPILTTSELPAHDHTVPGGGVTGSTGGSVPVNNDQPSLALNYLIALDGIFPANGGGGGFGELDPTLGQITEFAGNYAPGGWAFANGQLLSIAQDSSLFEILGTTYGGDGINTFALPDLRGRTLIGSGLVDGVDHLVGETFGTDFNTLTVANLAAHDHTLPDTPIVLGPATVPEPASLALLGLGIAGALISRRRM